jgi:hypothetical protein
MENVKQSSTNVSAKWAVIYVITSIVITYTFQFLNIDQSSSARYLAYIPFIVFLLLAQKEYKDQLGGFVTFGKSFMAGFIYSVIAGVILAVFVYIYLGILSPQVLEQSLASQHDKLVENGMSSEQIEQATEMGRKYGAIFGGVAVLFFTPITGAIIALIGAAIFKKERSILDIEQNSDANTDPAV